MQSLTSLVSIVVLNCPCLESFPQGCWPPNLESLRIGNIKKQPISKWGLDKLPTSLVDFRIKGNIPGLMLFSGVGIKLPTSLVRFHIKGDIPGLVSFSGVGIKLPTSLTKLTIDGLQSIESLSMGLENLTSLQNLRIYDCLKLQSLPDMLLPTLSSLKMRGCPLVEERCLQEKKDYWPKISHIPYVKIRP
ncbi:hypothetical protein LguiB_027984 [Lonicera macranthoides]